ncbi:PrsW family intramembrane metalloprotease [Clostridioides sp. ES-S-0108-01]|uniref:PrsW family intramembrane metalloprotease n=1 Tax=Clostridioides sp. ES-S-0108-01 TaxID=2770773 RepID=UPI001D0C7B50|nr:PrsW family intramembrane metalloprotease [Clostridioides sp. ES-S-0108-01]UDN51659.1 PrsW family intramembrane metalloprotease [Clostridioides sp. ES-S-0107-01]
MKLDLFLLAIVPILIGMFWIRSKDRYCREPLIHLIKFFLIGVFLSVIIILLEDLLMKFNVFEGYSELIYVSFIVAGLVEEGVKALILIPALIKEKHFTEKLDGIIYSVFLALGFATVENIVYVFSESGNLALQVGINRAVISIPAHVMFAITMGYYISKYKFEGNKNKRREYLFMAVLIPILLHGVFDFILMIEYRWAIILLIVYVIILWKINLDKLEKYMNHSKKVFFGNLKKKKKK